MNDIRKYVELIENQLLINESPMPEYVHKRRKYYHGTSNEDKAWSIIKNGIDIQHYEQRKGANLIPISGRNYLTTDINYAIIYALGGNLIGRDFPQALIERDGRYGFVFMVKGNRLNDIQPDEDSIGDILSHIARKNWSSDDAFKKSLKYAESKKKRKFYRNVYSDKKVINSLENLLHKNANNRQIRLIREYDFEMSVHVAKKILKSMPDWLKLKIITYGAHLSNDSVLEVSEAWKIDKMRSIEIEKDGRNFFDISEKVL